MNDNRRPTSLIVLVGTLPAVLVLVTLWVYGLLVEGMKNSLHEQRAVILRNLPFEGGLNSQKNFSWAILNPTTGKITQNSLDWPGNYDPETILRFKDSFGPGVESGVEVDVGASGPAILWIVSAEGSLRAALQSRRSFYARLESMRMLVWLAGVILSGGICIVCVMMARKLSDGFNDMENKNRELERANRNLEELGTLKSNFLALVSHELRTPLARLSGQIQILQAGKGLFPEEAVHRIEEMGVEIDELNRMTKNVLDLTRLQSEDLSARMELGQICEVVKGAVQRVASSAQFRGIELAVSAPETPPIRFDPYLLDRILDNLLVNAIKYSTEKGRISVRVVEEGEFVHIQVENSGPTIPTTEREKIFEKFHRVTKETDIPGTGLGLYLVRQFIHMMAGRVWVEAISDGNRFIVTLPLS